MARRKRGDGAPPGSKGDGALSGSSQRPDAQFLAMMSHEFRTPLTAVLGMLQLLESTELDTEQRRSLEAAERGARQLQGLVDNLMAYAVLETGAAQLDAAPFNLRDAIEEAGDLTRLDARDKGLTLAIDVDAALDGLRNGDVAWLRRAVVNLLDNAVKFTAAGGVRLEARPEKGDRVVVTVSDTGLAITADEEGRLFDETAVGDDTSTRRYGGAGLGLAIARKIAELMGGGVEARPGEGEGARFVMSVPLPRAKAKAETAAPQTRARRRVLVAEDNKVNQRLIKALMEKFGHEVVIVDDGAQALEAIAGAVYDIVILDVHMPVMDGIAATRAIREQGGESARVPILALTADARGDIEARARDAGVTAILEKPIDVARLGAAIDRLTV